MKMARVDLFLFVFHMSTNMYSFLFQTKNQQQKNTGLSPRGIHTHTRLCQQGYGTWKTGRIKMKACDFWC